MTAPGTDPRPLLLLPPSKGKAAGGDGPTYPSTLTTSTSLCTARTQVLATVRSDLDGLDDRALARIAGVRAKDVDEARAELRSLDEAATLPAHRRYTGVVHGNAGLAGLDPAQLEVDVRIVSALAGLVELTQPLPPYRLEFAASLPSLGGIATWWRDRLADHLGEVVAARRVWDLLPGEHARVWNRRARASGEVVEIAFVRPDGGAANAARTKVCKGRLAAFLIATAETDVDTVVSEADPGEGWKLASDARGIRATFIG